MARFWLNLGWDDCHFVHLLLQTNRQKFLKKTLISHSLPHITVLHASCNNYKCQSCVLGYLLLTLYFLFSCCKLQLTRYLPFFLMLQQTMHANANAMQYLVEHRPLLITVYLQLIFGKSCQNKFSFGGKKKEKKKEKTRENLTTLI